MTTWRVKHCVGGWPAYVTDGDTEAICDIPLCKECPKINWRARFERQRDTSVSVQAERDSARRDLAAAQAEIARDQAEIARLRAALETVAAPPVEWSFAHLSDLARAALAGKVE